MRRTEVDREGQWCVAYEGFREPDRTTMQSGNWEWSYQHCDTGCCHAGPLSTDEKITAFAFAVTISLWIFGAQIGVNAVAAALLGLSILLITGVVEWKENLAQVDVALCLSWLLLVQIRKAGLMIFNTQQSTFFEVCFPLSFQACHMRRHKWVWLSGCILGDSVVVRCADCHGHSPQQIWLHRLVLWQGEPQMLYSVALVSAVCGACRLPLIPPNTKYVHAC